MPVYTPTRLGQAQAGVAYAALYTVPVGRSAIIKEIVVCNTTGGQVNLDVSLVASGGTAGIANAVIYSHPIDPYSTVMWTFSQVLAAGGFVSIRAGAAGALTVTASGVEIV